METEIYRDFEHTSPGTLAGRYMRLFWQPVYRAEDLAPGQAIPIRIMSEDLTLYRGQSSVAYLVASRCAHRGTQLSTGWVEDDCIRCRYHGWKYDGSGQCIEQPGEKEPFTGKVRIRTHPVEEYLGLIFAYLGEGCAPPLRRYPQFEQRGVLMTLPPELWPCNYFNRLDNDADAFHPVFTHKESIRRANRTQLYRERPVVAELTPYGVKTAVSIPGASPELRSYMPNVNQIRVLTGVTSARPEEKSGVWEDRLTWAVSVDDNSSLRFEVNLAHLTDAEGDSYKIDRQNELERIRNLPQELGGAILEGKLSIEELPPSLSTYEIFRIEDYVVQVGQGQILDRSHERLGRLDIGIVLRRKLWERELRALAQGRPLSKWATTDFSNDSS